MIINTNLSSQSTQRNLSAASAASSTAMQKLSTGLRINSANDDAAGLAIAGRLDAQAVQVSSANMGVSMAQTAESALSKVSDTLQRMRELAVQSQAGSSTGDGSAIQKEFSQLADEINQIGQQTSFGGQKILGENAGTSSFQVGSGEGGTVDVATQEVSAASLGVEGLKLGGADAVDAIDKAIQKVSDQRSNLGDVIKKISASSENSNAAKSGISGDDMAKEMSNYSKQNVLNQAAQSMLAQGNQPPKDVLQLLKG